MACGESPGGSLGKQTRLLAQCFRESSKRWSHAAAAVAVQSHLGFDAQRDRRRLGRGSLLTGSGGGDGSGWNLGRKTTIGAERLVDLSPLPFAPRISPEDAPDGPLREFSELIRQRQRTIAAEIYVEHLTYEDLEELLRFFESELGLSLVETCSVLRERMRKALPSLQAECAKEAGLDDRQIGGPLASHISKSDGE